MLRPDSPALILAPMEGVTDAPMRALQGAGGAFTFAVSEFLRVAHLPISRTSLLRHVPELRTGCRTPTGLPVQVQLLGGDAGLMAESAATAVALGAIAIDLNFGCPAPTVNRHDGGATLLRYPRRIREIVAAVRAAVPVEVPVSAKMRLGWDRVDAIFENAAMAAEGGAEWITIHARTRTQGYAPPVFWPLIGQVRDQLGIPVVANGDIRTIAEFRRCREESGCKHFMLGRGALADPELAGRVAAELGLAEQRPVSTIDWPAQLRRLMERTPDGPSPGLAKRWKQWLRIAAAYGTFKRFDEIKRATCPLELLAILDDSVREECFNDLPCDSLAFAEVPRTVLQRPRIPDA